MAVSSELWCEKQYVGCASDEIFFSFGKREDVLCFLITAIEYDSINPQARSLT